MPGTETRVWKLWVAVFVGLGLFSCYAWAVGRDRADLEPRSSWLQRSLSGSERRGDEIRTTTVPYRLPYHLSDAELSGGHEIDLAPLVPELTRHAGGLLHDAALRVRLGEPGRAYGLEIAWASAPHSNFEIEVYDGLFRPVGRWAEGSGSTGRMRVSGGMYRLVLSANGALGNGFRLTARAEDLGPAHADRESFADGHVDIPTIRVRMSPANAAVWEAMRRDAYEMLSPLGIPADLPSRRVTARLSIDGAESQARVWPAGRGLQQHADIIAPSMTVQVQAGPLVRGFSRFKLFSILTQHGLLDYTVASLLEDEGVFVPRKLLANVYLNNRNLGLYVVEEVAKNLGHFEQRQRHVGQVSAAGKVYADDYGVWRRKRPLTSGEEYAPGLVPQLDTRRFAKSIALVSRFHLTHVAERDDFRFYRPALLERIEPWLRDINVDASPNLFGGYGSLIIHAGWWLRPTIGGRAAHTNPKVHPPIPGLPSGDRNYQIGPAILPLSAIHPVLFHFLNSPERRAAFDAYLFYGADPAFKRRLDRRLRETLDATRSILRANRMEAGIVRQLNTYARRDFVAARAIRAFRRLSRVLLRIQPEDTGGEATSASNIVTVYNLSPFSATLKLPEFVSMAGQRPRQSNQATILLAPSELFFSVAPFNGNEEAVEATASWFPSQSVAHRLLSLEGVRYRARPDEARGAPMAVLRLSDGDTSRLLEWLRRNPAVKLGGIYSLPTESVARVADLADGEAPFRFAAAERPNNWGRLLRPLEEPDLLVYLMDEARVRSGVRFTYVISNLSAGTIDLNLDKLALNEISGAPVDVKISSAWLLDQSPRLLHQSTLSLAPSVASSDWSGPPLPSVWLWPGGLNGVRRGTAVAGRPNSVLVEMIARACGIVSTDVSGLAAASGADSAVQVVVLEPTWNTCSSTVAHSPIGTTLKPVTVYSSDDNQLGRPPHRFWRDDVTTYHTIVAVQDGHPAPWRAEAVFDDDAWTYWRPDPGLSLDQVWLAFDFGEPTTLSWIAMLPAPDGQGGSQAAGAELLLQGSDAGADSTSWESLGSLVRLGLTRDEYGHDWARFEVPGARPYRAYRIVTADRAALWLRELRFETGPTPTGARHSVSIEDLIESGALVRDSMAGRGTEYLRPAGPSLAIDGLLEIPENQILELPAGTVIRFGPDGGLLSYGTIRALGTEDAPVRFLPSAEELGFLGLAIVDSGHRSIFQHVELTGARGGFFGAHQVSGGLSVYGSSIDISHSRFSNLWSNDGIHLSHADFTIEESVVEGTRSDAIDIDWSFGSIVGSSFLRCGTETGDCVDTSGSLVTLRDSQIAQAADKGLSIGEGSVVTIAGLRVTNSRTGIAVKDGALVEIDGCTLSENEYGLLRYIKKPFYPYPELAGTPCLYEDNAVARVDEPEHIWTRRYD